MTDFMNLKIKPTQSFRCVHIDKMYVSIFIKINIHTYMRECVYTMFIKKRKIRDAAGARETHTIRVAQTRARNSSRAPLPRGATQPKAISGPLVICATPTTKPILPASAKRFNKSRGPSPSLGSSPRVQDPAARGHPYNGSYPSDRASRVIPRPGSCPTSLTGTPALLLKAAPFLKFLLVPSPRKQPGRAAPEPGKAREAMPPPRLGGSR
jgi:hypothetical protein